MFLCLCAWVQVNASVGRGHRHGFPEAGVTGVFELTDVGAWNWNSKQYMLLTAGSPLQVTPPLHHPIPPFKGKVYFAISVHYMGGGGHGSMVSAVYGKAEYLIYSHR